MSQSGSARCNRPGTARAGAPTSAPSRIRHTPNGLRIANAHLGHVQVALLEDLQRQQSVGEQYRAQREDRNLELQCGSRLRRGLAPAWHQVDVRRAAGRARARPRSRPGPRRVSAGGRSPGLAGRMTAPARASRSMFSRWMADSGVSRGTSTSLRASLSMTSAARSIRLSASPLRDGRQRAHAARTDHHGVGRVRARGHRGKPLLAPECAQLPRLRLKRARRTPPRPRRVRAGPDPSPDARRSARLANRAGRRARPRRADTPAGARRRACRKRR